MGLSGRKQKQRIPNDPRNLSWADDASRFGSSYLSKFGWDASKGLGATGEGRTSHIKVSQKLDMMGIGAAHQKDPNGIAWKQNRDFENLLKRLNEPSAQGKVETGATVDMEVKEVLVVEVVQSKDGERRKREKKDKEKAEKREVKKEKKRKHDGEEDRDDKKKRRKSSEELASETKDVEMKGASTTAPAPAPSKPQPPRYRAHRTRAIAAKSISSKSSAHIAEILGIAPSDSTSPSESMSMATSGSATPADQGKLTVISELEKLTTSTKSVADYFKEKLQLKSSKCSSATNITENSNSSDSPTTALGLGMTRRTNDYDDERPVGGLGFGGGGLGISKMRLESQEECNVVNEATMRMGLSKFSSLTSSQFLSSLDFIKERASPGASETKVAANGDGLSSSSSEEEERRKERKRRRKAEKEKKAGAGEKKKKERTDKRKEEETVGQKEKKDKRASKDKKDKKSRKAEHS